MYSTAIGDGAMLCYFTISLFFFETFHLRMILAAFGTVLAKNLCYLGIVCHVEMLPFFWPYGDTVDV